MLNLNVPLICAIEKGVFMKNKLRFLFAAVIITALAFSMVTCGSNGAGGGGGGSGGGGGYDGGPDPDLNPKDERQTASNLAGWNAALTEITNGGNGALGDPKTYTITINGDIGVPGRTTNNFGNVQYVTVKLTGTGKVYLTSQGYLLRIGDYQAVYIDGALTLQGLTPGQNGLVQTNSFYSTIYVNGGTFELKNGTISGNTANVIPGGFIQGCSGVYINKGRFTMSGGTISDNTSNVGGGVCLLDGEFNMTGGTITGNTATDGGGVSVGGSFTMTGGTIRGNTASGEFGYGGGVFVSQYGSYTMTEGTISDNTARQGGGVYVEKMFTMTGGTITRNTARLGRGVCVSYDGTFNINSPATTESVHSNTAASSGNIGSYQVFAYGIFKVDGKLTADY
jgi:hypothetical protein